LDDQAARLENAALLGVEDEVHARAVLDRAARIEELGLAEDAASSKLGGPAQSHEGRVADRAREAVTNIHRRLHACLHYWPDQRYNSREVPGIRKAGWSRYREAWRQVPGARRREDGARGQGALYAHRRQRVSERRCGKEVL